MLTKINVTRQGLTFINNDGKCYLHCMMNRLPYVCQLLPHSPTDQARDTNQAIPLLSLLQPVEVPLPVSSSTSLVARSLQVMKISKKISSLTYIIVAMITIYLRLVAFTRVDVSPDAIFAWTVMFQYPRMHHARHKCTHGTPLLNRADDNPVSIRDADMCTAIRAFTY